MRVGLRGVRWGVSDFLYSSFTKPLSVCFGFAAAFNLFFDYPNFGGRGAPRRSTTVPLGRELVCFHRLSIQTILVSSTVWLHLRCKF